MKCYSAPRHPSHCVIICLSKAEIQKIIQIPPQIVRVTLLVWAARLKQMVAMSEKGWKTEMSSKQILVFLQILYRESFLVYFEENIY